jgi:hypothetical protein
MFTPGFDPMRFDKIRQQEFMREAQQYRLVQEALRARPRKVSMISKMLVLVGKWFVSVGASLERRFGDSPQAEAYLVYNPASKDCY